jgi:small subunit ribosomal protein S20
MPITKSAKKSLRVSQTKRAQNQTNKVVLEKALRKADVETVNSVMSTIDKSAKTGLIHKNKAARLKSRLAKKLGTPKAEKIESPKSVKSIKSKETKTVKKVSKTSK